MRARTNRGSRLFAFGLSALLWTVPAGAQATATEQNPTYAFSFPGTHAVTLKVCNDFDCSEVTQQVVVLDPTPRVTGIAPVPARVGLGQVVALSAETAGRPPRAERWLVSGTAGALQLDGNPASWGTTTPGLGTYEVRIEVLNSDGSVISAPSTVEVVRMSFADVPPSLWAWKYIEGIYDAGLTGGCALNPRRYCPDAATTRTEMAIFLVRATRGPDFVPPPAAGIFSDVPVTHWAASRIEQIYADGLTQGCGLNPLRFCPDALLTRAEMAIFLLRAKHGAGYLPPLATGTVFADVPSSHWAAAWIEQLRAEGITSGCGTNPLRYCPDNTTDRAEMAAFLTRTFNLPTP
jgi:hypothetical protein